jgi:predicted DNA-binding transcriptional regulator AlpA
MTISSLQSTAWLAKWLGLSVTTIERLRAQKSNKIPPHITIGSSIKYDEATVNAWIQSRLEASAALQQAGASHE